MRDPKLAHILVIFGAAASNFQTLNSSLVHTAHFDNSFVPILNSIDFQNT